MLFTGAAGVDVEERKLEELLFADDIVSVANTRGEAVELLRRLEEESGKFGLKLNKDKTKFTVFNAENSEEQEDIYLGGEKIEHVNNYVYLGCNINNDGNDEVDLERRIQLANITIAKLKKLIWNKKFHPRFRNKLFMCFVFPVVVYGSQTWTMTKQMEKRVNSWWIKQMRIMTMTSKLEHTRNEKILGEVDQIMLSEHIKRKRMLYLGHVYKYPDERWAKFALTMKLKGQEARGKKMTWQKMVRKDLKVVFSFFTFFTLTLLSRTTILSSSSSSHTAGSDTANTTLLTSNNNIATTTTAAATTARKIWKIRWHIIFGRGLLCMSSTTHLLLLHQQQRTGAATRGQPFNLLLASCCCYCCCSVLLLLLHHIHSQ